MFDTGYRLVLPPGAHKRERMATAMFTVPRHIICAVTRFHICKIHRCITFDIGRDHACHTRDEPQAESLYVHLCLIGYSQQRSAGSDRRKVSEYVSMLRSSCEARMFLPL